MTTSVSHLRVSQLWSCLIMISGHKRLPWVASVHTASAQANQTHPVKHNEMQALNRQRTMASIGRPTYGVVLPSSPPREGSSLKPRFNQIHGIITMNHGLLWQNLHTLPSPSKTMSPYLEAALQRPQRLPFQANCTQTIMPLLNNSILNKQQRTFPSSTLSLAG